MKRIEDFLAEDEVEDWASSVKRHQECSPPEPSKPMRIGYETASFRWHISAGPAIAQGEPDNTQPGRLILRDITASFPSGKLSLITGPTGSGKSSLLNALLGGSF